MLSINTNLSSLIAQNNMKTSSFKLDTAIERMTTGYKINHAKDNAANYSISTNMTTKIGAYMVAEDNVLSGLDLVSTATEVISMMEDRASRLSALSIQARNGTNGAKSLEALNAEAGAIASEITRLYNSTQFNNVNLFNRSSFTLDENLPQAGESGFIEEPVATFAMRATPTSPPTAKSEYGGFIANPYTYTADQVANMTALTDDVTTIISGKEYSISNVDELVNLRELVNSGVDTTGAIFVLGADIDLSSIANWDPIGTVTNQFDGEFNGNGHKISNLISSGNYYRGLFGVSSNVADIKNVSVINYKITTTGYSGGIVGKAKSTVTNCYTTGNMYNHGEQSGGLVGVANANVVDCYSNSVLEVGWRSGGLVGFSTASIINSFSMGSVDSTSTYTGGLVGLIDGTTENCYSTADVKALGQSGGLIGESHSLIKNSFTTGNVVSSGDSVGGLVGYVYGEVIDCYATGNVSANSHAGGLIGQARSSISNCYSTGNVSGLGDAIGGFIGKTTNILSLTNCYATGNVSSSDTSKYIGGFAGFSDSPTFNCYATGNVTGGSYVGGFTGHCYYAVENSYATGNVQASGDYAGGFTGNIGSMGKVMQNSYATGDVTSAGNNVGGFAGYSASTLTSCYATGDVSGEKFVGGLVGQGYKVSETTTYTGCHAYGKANGTEGVGGLIGGAVLTTNGTSFGKINLVDCQAVKQGAGSIGGVYQYDSATTTYTLLSSYDMTSMTSGIEEYMIMPTTTTLHLGINGNDSSSLSFDTNFIFDFSPMNSSVESDEFYNSVNSFVKHLQEKTTILGAVQNRLESALDEISIQYENLVSSRSTIRDADMSEVSSEYIRQQILQQASATLMSTANQSPAIALQLI